MKINRRTQGQGRCRQSCPICGYRPATGEAMVVITRRHSPRKVYHATKQPGCSASCWEKRHGTELSPREYWEALLVAEVKRDRERAWTAAR